MRFAILLACVNSALAVNYAEWLQHNGLASNYNRISKEHGPFVQEVEAQTGGVTAFVPTNDAVTAWLKANPTLTYETINDTFKYMVTVGNSLTLKDLEKYNGQKLPTLLPNEEIKVSAQGASPDLTIVLQSGDNYNTSSTAGIANQDFVLDNGYVQLVSVVFELPSEIYKKAQQNKEVNAAPKASLGAGFLLSAFTIGAMALL